RLKALFLFRSFLCPGKSPSPPGRYGERARDYNNRDSWILAYIAGATGAIGIAADLRLAAGLRFAAFLAGFFAAFLAAFFFAGRFAAFLAAFLAGRFFAAAFFAGRFAAFLAPFLAAFLAGRFA